jgi:hypothetical protein
MGCWIQHLPRCISGSGCGYQTKNCVFNVSSSVADPDPGSGAFLTKGSGIGKNSESLQTILGVKIHKSFDANADPGSRKLLTLDPGSGREIFGFGIRDKYPGSATLVSSFSFLTYYLLCL